MRNGDFFGPPPAEQRDAIGATHPNGERGPEYQDASVRALWAITRIINPGVTSHELAVGTLAGRIAHALGFDAAMTQRTEIAGRVHDVGLNGVDVHILDSRDPLTPLEYNILQLHAERGEMILLAIPSLSELAPSVRSHHERFDGTGYPDQLCADAIPIESRIIAVADAYHAMTTLQHWRSAFSPFAAVQELVRGSGKQFDPIIVDTLIRLLGERAEGLSETA